ncbi:MAG TPA: chorismate synthase [Rhodothermales bacterium]|nr:chorismate synthase [Rhodothermales bacterium]
MLRFLTAGESHGPALVGIVEGLPAGVPLTQDDLDVQLARRWQGFGRGGRAKFEADHAEVVSGLRFGRTTGAPVALRIENAAHARDRSGWPEVLAPFGTGEGVEKVTLPRPGHADLPGVQKYGFDDVRPVIERASARETAMRVACGSLARALLRGVGIEVGSHVVALGNAGYEDGWEAVLSPLVAQGAEALARAADQSEVRMLDPDVSARAIEAVKQAKADGDTLGGVYEVVATGVPAGLGSYVQWDRRLDGLLAQSILSIQAQKAVEVGDGVLGAALPGSRVHDPIVQDADRGFSRASNHAGGIEGGMTNGMPVVVRGYMKPIPTLIRPLMTVDLASGEAVPTRYERSDVTSVPAAAVVAEAAVCWTLAGAVLERFGGDRYDWLVAQVQAARVAAGR